MTEHRLTHAEQALVEKETRWAQERELVRVAPGRKLLRLLGTDGGEYYATLVSGPAPNLIFHEPVRFIVIVHAARGECRAGHTPGDRWEVVA